MLGYVKLLVTVTYYIFSADLQKKENLQYLKSLTRVYDQLSRDVRCWLHLYIPGSLFVRIFQKES